MTTSYSDQDLEPMLADLESDLVERKESFRGEAPRTVREAVCAFANDLPDHRRAGVVFVGRGAPRARRSMGRIPSVYRGAVLGEPGVTTVGVDNDPHCLATLKPYRSLMSLAREARKPMFFLKPADGAIGAHALAVQGCSREFRELARRLADRCGVALP